MPRQKLFFLILTIFAAILVLSQVYNYQGVIAQGDHGRDLYCFQRTMDGAKPYVDYWWVYGPLMPYYYSLFYKIFGVSILSVAIGKSVLIFLCVAFVYLILCDFIAPGLAFLAGIWFLIFNHDFFITYNHVGGITALLGLTYCLFRSIKNPALIYKILGLVFVFLLCLIKINFGITALLIFLISHYVIDKTNPLSPKPNKAFYLLSLFLIPAVIALIYAVLLSPLPMYAIRQCLPYLSADHPYNPPFFVTLSGLLTAMIQNIFSNIPNLGFAFLINISALQVICAIKTKTISLQEKRNFCVAAFILVLFYVINLHEFLMSGVNYRLFWAVPFSILLIFLIMGTAVKTFHRTVGLLVSLTILFIVSLSLIGALSATRFLKSPQNYFDLRKTDIYIGNDPGWKDTVIKTTLFLKSHLQKDEKFFALPYDCIYYFLTDTISPTRQLIFFDHINIPPEQEQTIIADLEKEKVNWIVVSSRSASKETAMGTLGKTYCPLIGKYIDENFEAVVQYGDWVNPPGWAWNHGTKILKRK